MNGCTHFRCDSCDKVKPIKEHNIVKAAYTKVDDRSINNLMYNIYKIQLCDKCLKDGEKNDEEEIDSTSID